MAAPLAFYFDFVSPYAYLGWTQVHAVAARHGREVRPMPVLFAALLAHSGTRGPAEIPLKRNYLLKDTIRIARTLGVPFQWPPAHPFNPLLALRIAGLVMADDKRRRVIDALCRGAWASGAGIDTPERVGAALSAAGIDPAPLLAAAAEPEAKQRLRDATDAAITAGLFGVPSFVADGELFWGTDSLPHLERWLGGHDALAGIDQARLLALPMAVKRPS